MAKISNTNILILLQTAKKLGIAAKILDLEKYKISLTKNGQHHIIWEKSLGINPSSAIKISRDKHLTYLTLKKAGLPVLPQILVKKLAGYATQIQSIKFPIVIKPLYGEKGKDIYLNIKTQTEGLKVLKKYFAKAKKFKEQKNSYCVIEPYFPAQDYRFLVLASKVIGLSQRLPPTIKADGQHTIKELIQEENQTRLQENKKAGKRMLNRILIWSRVKWYLAQQGLKLEDILPKDKKITLYPIPNFSTGGTVKALQFLSGSAGAKVHPSFISLAQKTAKAVGLTIIGIDLLVKDITKPASSKNCAIVEVNSDPGLRLHDWPNFGAPQHVTEQILNFIFSIPT